MPYVWAVVCQEIIPADILHKGLQDKIPQQKTSMVLKEEKMEPATQNVALTIDQMRSLMSLGMNCEDASMVYHPISQHTDIFNLRVTNIEERKAFWDNPRRVAIVGEDYYNRVYGRDVPAYTADDILRKIPKEIAIHGIKHRLFFTIRSVQGQPEYQASYNFADDDGKMVSAINNIWKSDSFLLLLYGILVWSITNKHLPL